MYREDCPLNSAVGDDESPVSKRGIAGLLCKNLTFGGRIYKLSGMLKKTTTNNSVGLLVLPWV